MMPERPWDYNLPSEGFVLPLPNSPFEVIPVTHDELLEDIERTMHEISKIKRQIEETTGPREKRRLIRRKKELQYLQLWHHDLLERQK